MTPFESLDRSCYSAFAEMNCGLLEAVRRGQPDLVFCVLLGYEVWTETLDLIRGASPVLVINWGTDDSCKYNSFARYVAPHVDVWATTSAAAAEQALNDGHRNFVLTQWGASRDLLLEPLPARQCKHAVSFVGSAYGNRRQWIESLRARGIDVQCFSPGRPAGPVDAEDIPRIYRDSMLTLNFGDSGLQLKGLKPYRSRELKARVFEVPGAGGCLLTELGPGRLLWGSRRGPRAARRALHELSWRLVGERTYSARGLPGRLFYRES